MSIHTPRTDPRLLGLLRADLVSSGFTVQGVTELLGPLASAALDREQFLPAQRVTGRSREPCAVLVRLFTLGDPVDAAEVAGALPTLGVTGALELGLIAPEGDGVVALCDLRPYAGGGADWWVASDLAELATGKPLREDHVLGIGGASTTLASWTPRPHVERALDLGTGCGVQALHLDAHADEVVVTDLSERALGYARFNASLDDAQWEIRAGSMLDPVIVSALIHPIRPTDGLSTDDEQLLELVANGRTIKAIAISLHSTPAAVDDRVEQLFIHTDRPWARWNAST